MARYEHLPIYKKAMELGVYLETVVKNFSRYNKYTIGKDLRDLSRKIVSKLSVPTHPPTGSRSGELVEYCEMFKTTIFFAKEAKAFPGSTVFSMPAACCFTEQTERGLAQKQQKEPESSTARKGGSMSVLKNTVRHFRLPKTRH